METSKSPRTAMRVAYCLARDVLPDRTHRFSRKDFTLPQLFACLVVREILRLSYRKAEAFLADSPDWLAEIGMGKPPDHNTLWRAFGALCTLRRLNRMLDLQAQLVGEARRLMPPDKPLAADSTCFEQRHCSPHYERRCRHMGLAAGATCGRKASRSPDQTRSQKLSSMPKLALAGAACCHLVLAARTHLGAGSDAPDWPPLLRDACRRAPVKTAVADAGYDSEANHRLSRRNLAVRSIIPAKIGRRTQNGQPPTGYWRRQMHYRFARGADKALYGERAQAETINSMLKRNLGDCLRSRLPRRRENEMLFRAVVHNFTLVAALDTG